jgi:RNA polymerase sigma factor (sigma-70 family)
MLPARPATLAARLAQLAAPPTDADLLARFLAVRDESAFAELVRRHGPAVLAACRRVTRHTHDAEDAFQATFLVLARKAGRVRPGPLAGWLYGVALRAARKAASRRRDVAGVDVPDLPERQTEPFDPDTARAVAEEVGRLSTAYRAAVVLCELEGRPRAAAARELGIAEGTLSSRLAAARRELADRLKARGFGPAALSAMAGVGVPPQLADAASRLSTGSPVPAAVAALTPGVVRIMSPHTLAAAAVALGLLAVVARPDGPPPPTPRAARVEADAAPARSAPGERLKGPNRLFVACNEDLIRLDPAGKEQRPFRQTEGCMNYLALSWEGKRVAGVVTPVRKNPGDPLPRPRLYVRELGADAPRTDLGETGMNHVAAWSGDGTAVVLVGWDYNEHAAPGKQVSRVRNVVMSVATGDEAAVPLPDHHYVRDWSRDERVFLVEHVEADRDQSSLWLAGRDGVKQKRVTDGTASFFLPSLSADGARVLLGVARFTPADPPGGGAGPVRHGDTLVVADPATGTMMPVRNVSPHARINGLCWSPDGRHVAYVWQDLDPNNPDVPPRGTLYYLTVCEPDGSNPRTVFKRLGEEPDEVAMSRVSWR